MKIPMEEILRGLLGESKEGILSIPLPTFLSTKQAEETQTYWSMQCPSLAWELEIREGRWFLLVAEGLPERTVPQ